MKKIKIYQSLLMVFTLIFTNACVEQIDIETLTFEDALVVEAVLTNELKTQEVKLSRSFKFDDESAIYESGAEVKVLDGNNNSFDFKETIPGKYISVEPFKAESGINYQLNIKTKNGKTYVSNKVELTKITPINEVYASRETDEFGIEGMSIFVDSYDPSGESKYYRYEYEETYKIVAPYWNPFDLVVVNDRYVKEPKKQEEKTCYNSVHSNTIIQKETTGLTEDRVSRFEVRFISRYDPIISHRYSILVKQYVQSLDAYTYFKTLDKLSGGSGNIFSQNQPGFFNGNIFSEDNSDEKVIGFFEVSSVSSKRIFFDFDEFFPNEALPPYFIECELVAPSTKMEAGEPSQLMGLLNSGKVKYYERNPNYPNPDNENEGEYNVVKAPCGDCTELGSNIKPAFWVD